MRSLTLATLSMSGALACVCGCDEPRVPEPRAPQAPVARREAPPTTTGTPAVARRDAPAAALSVAPRSAPVAELAATATEPGAPASHVAHVDRCDGPTASDAPAVVAVDPREATRRAAHEVLAKYCGECHEGHRPTAKPKALAVFDLDKPDWPSRFDDHKFRSALGRLSSKSDAARDAFIAFRDAELAASSAKPH